jgi:chromodomain-helicase-DNA-binding protein 4
MELSPCKQRRRAGTCFFYPCNLRNSHSTLLFTLQPHENDGAYIALSAYPKSQLTNCYFKVSHDDILRSRGGAEALTHHFHDSNLAGESSLVSRTRKRTRQAFTRNESDNDSDDVEFDGDNDELIYRMRKRPRSSTRSSRRSRRQVSRMPSSRGDDEDDFVEEDEPRYRSTRNLRTRQAQTKYNMTNGTHPTSRHPPEDDEDDFLKEESQARSTRNLGRRQTRFNYKTTNEFKRRNPEDEEDELAQDLPPDSPEGSDGDFILVTSDLVKAPAGRKLRTKSRRLKIQLTSQASASRSRGSSIEFEAPRRSGRSTRNVKNMLDPSAMDDESFYVEDEKLPAAPKITNIKEVFQSVPPDTDFGKVHVPICDSCDSGPSPNKGQLIGCQGCSLAWHKSCVGYRHGRDHIVTKVGHDDFVLQCRYCIANYKKKDENSPSQDMCQVCRIKGKSCAPFAPRRTAKQEEKIRLENGGVDPITKVPPELINNANNVLFRCVGCHRPWHIEHLPSTRTAVSDLTSLREERFAEYSVDWKCNECMSTKHRIGGLVAWRPRIRDAYLPGQIYSDIEEDEMEYLIKWEERSYRHCTWMPGAWVFGVASPKMRAAFGKRNSGNASGLPKFDEKGAIPEEYLKINVILNVKMEKSSYLRSKQADTKNIRKVAKIFVNFQGLEYDQVVWDSPPADDSGPFYEAFESAYQEYLNGKYFAKDSSAKIRDRIKAFRDQADNSGTFQELTEQPHGLKRGKLMTYQLQGVNWLLSKFWEGNSAVLADEMGLGKTIQIIALLTTLVQDDPQCWPFLIVVPNSTCPNWRREIKQWSPDLRVVAYHGGRGPQELAYKYELFPEGPNDMKAHVVVMSYDSAQDERTRVLFKSVRWAGLIVDEGQRLKNDQNILYGALRAMNIPFRVLLTGTPLQNNKRELFNLIQFIDPTMKALELDEKYQEVTAQNIPELHKLIRPYFLRRTKIQVLKFLPAMAQIIVPVTMTVLQEKLCKSIIAKNPDLIKAIFANSKMAKKERGSLNNILVQLRKCLCHPFIYSEAVEERSADPEVAHRNLISASAKLVLLEIMLRQLKKDGHRVLIFSQFLGQLDIVEDFLNGMGYEFRRLDGTIGSLEKQRRIDAFNAPDSTLFAFLLSTRAGGVGINLATADTVIIMDPDFNPHQDIQALSRAHRIGQKKDVLCIQLMTKNSVEEKIMQIGRKKMALDHVLIEVMDDDKNDEVDLESILKHGAEALFNEDQQKHAIHYDEVAVAKLLDRSSMEKSLLDEDKNTEKQFSFAKVWSNDTGSFNDEELAAHTAPIEVNSSIWESILVEREAEAKRIAELNREILGRGGRRRQVRTARRSFLISWKLTIYPQAINYQPSNGIEEAVGDINSSDNDGDFIETKSADEEDDEDEAYQEGKRTDRATSAKGKSNKKSPLPVATPNLTPRTPRKKAVGKTVNKVTKQAPTPSRRAPRSSHRQSPQLASRVSTKAKRKPPTPRNTSRASRKSPSSTTASRPDSDPAVSQECTQAKSAKSRRAKLLEVTEGKPSTQAKLSKPKFPDGSRLKQPAPSPSDQVPHNPSQALPVPMVDLSTDQLPPGISSNSQQEDLAKAVDYSRTKEPLEPMDISQP